MRYSFLGLCFNQTCRLSWKLQHRSLLPLENVRQEHDLPVWKLKGIVMGPRLILVDLPKHGRGVADRPPGKHPSGTVSYALGECQFGTRKNANS
jgi:hypothetical protein